MAQTQVFIDRPWLMPVLWSALHVGVYVSTLVAARAHDRASDIMSFEAYEWHPLFRRDSEGARWPSGRFLLALGAVGFFLWAHFRMMQPLRDAQDAVCVSGSGLGALIFTAIIVVGNHLRNAWLFRHLLRHPQLAYGRFHYSLQLSRRISGLRFVVFASVLGVAAVLSSHPWLVGGAVGCLLLALRDALQSLRGRASASRGGPSGE